MGNHQDQAELSEFKALLIFPAVIEQRIYYISENPVRAGFAGVAHEYYAARSLKVL